MCYIEKENGEILTEQDAIKNEVKLYYEKLYKSQEAAILNVDLSTVVDGPSLSDIESESIEGCITVPEALSALKK